MIKIAQFGAGLIGKVHSRNLASNPRADLQFIYDVNSEAAEQLAAHHGAKVAASPEEIWASDVEAVNYPNLVDGLRAQMIAEAAVESLKSNRPVKITYWQPE